MRVRSLVVLVLLAAAAFCLGSAPVGAEVITQRGACAGSGFWAGADIAERSSEHEPDDVIDVPIKDVVRWRGTVGDGKLNGTTERRQISGRVELELPLGQSVTVNDWGGSSVRVANRGRHKYDLPFFFKGVKMRLNGHHDENGRRVCSGSVYVKVEGKPLSNPLTWAGIAGLVISGGALLWAGRPVIRQDGSADGGVDPESSGRAHGHAIVGAIAGLVLGGSIGGLLLMFGAIPLESIVLVIAPSLGLLLGAMWAWGAPVGRRS